MNDDSSATRLGALTEGGDTPLEGAMSPLPTCPGALIPEARIADAPKRQPIEHGHLPFVIRRDGVWLYRGTSIERKEMVCLFASVLRRDAEGVWWLRTPAESGRIVVEDAPFIAVELDWTGDGADQVLSFRTNIDQVVTVGPDHPIRVQMDPSGEEPTPYVLVRAGDGAFGIEARVNRATYYELVALAVPGRVGDRDMLGVWSRGVFFPLGDLPPDDDVYGDEDLDDQTKDDA